MADGGAAPDLGIFSHVGENAAKDRAAGVDRAQFVKDHDGLLKEFGDKAKALFDKHFGTGAPGGGAAPGG